MGGDGYRQWYVVQTVELGASAGDVWKVIGGFFTIQKWHPDIERTEVPEAQTDEPEIRRVLTFPGQPKTTEELILMDNEGHHYTYKWHAGKWGEMVQDYAASLRVFDSRADGRSIVQWSSTFSYTEDAISEFYWNGFNHLLELFPLPNSEA